MRKFGFIALTSWTSVRTYVRPPLHVCQCDQYTVTISRLKFRAHRGGNIPFDTVTSLQHTSLILDINVMVNWHLSKQGIRWPVSRDHIAGSSWTLSRSAVFLKLAADQGLVVDWIAGSRKVRHTQTHTWTRLNFSRSFCGSTRLHSHSTSTKALDSRCFSCSGTVWKIYFSCIFRWFQSRFNII